MKEKQLCVLCGKNEATKGDGDHLPPQSIYPKPRTPGIALNKVPACTPCNNSGSKDDEEFKMIIGLTTGEYRVEQSQVIDSLARTMGKNKKMARRLLQRAQHVYARTQAGILMPMVSITLDRRAYSRVVQRIVRGLYWKETGQILGDREILVVHGDEPEGQLLNAIKHVLNLTDPTTLNGGTFVYKAAFTPDGESFWGLQFFKKHTVFATVLAAKPTTSGPQSTP